MEGNGPNKLNASEYKRNLNAEDLIDCKGENELMNSAISHKEEDVNIESLDRFHKHDSEISNLQKKGENRIDASQSTTTHLVNEEQNITEDSNVIKSKTINLQDSHSTISRTDHQVVDDHQHPTNSSEDNTHEHLNISHVTDGPPKLIIVSREEWRAIPPRRVSPKPHLAKCVVLTYATSSKACFTPHKCERVVRKLQRHHMRGGLPDIPYNFMVGGDGRVYEGRGWFANSRTLVQLTQLRGYLIEIAFLGDYKVERPNEAMLDAALELVQYGQNNSCIEEEFNLYENFEGLEIKPVNFDD